MLAKRASTVCAAAARMSTCVANPTALSPPCVCNAQVRLLMCRLAAGLMRLDAERSGPGTSLTECLLGGMADPRSLRVRRAAGRLAVILFERWQQHGAVLGSVLDHLPRPMAGSRRRRPGGGGDVEMTDEGDDSQVGGRGGGRWLGAGGTAVGRGWG